MSSDDKEMRSLKRLVQGMDYNAPIPSTFQAEWYAHHEGFLHFGTGKAYTGPPEEDALADFLFTGTTVTKEQFNETSPKPIRRLAGELVREVNLWKLAHGDFLKLSEKVRTQIHCPYEDVSLQEVSRYVVETGKEVEHYTPKRYGSSGTLERRHQVGNTVVQETPLEAARREIEQEHGFQLLPERFLSLSGLVPEVTREKSTMYQCPGIRIRSINVIWEFRIDVFSTVEWQSDKHWYEHGCLVYEDEGVLIRNCWLPPQELT